MSNCLITKLQGVVDNDSLRKLNEMDIDLLGLQSITALVIQSGSLTSYYVKARIVGDGYLTNYAGTANYGKSYTYTFNATNPENPNGKYNLYVAVSSGAKGKLFIEHEDVSKISFLVNLTIPSGGGINTQFNLNTYPILGTTASYLTLNGITSSVNNFLNKLKASTFTFFSLAINEAKDEILDLSTIITKVSDTLILTANDSVGRNKMLVDLSVLKGSTCKTISIANVGVYGNVTDILPLQDAPQTQLYSSSYTEREIFGDLANVTPKGTYLSLSGRNCKFTWSNRAAGSKILCFGAGTTGVIDLGSYVDAMLINQATLEPRSSYAGVAYAVISCKGIRTAASDAAIQSLTSKGITVTIQQ